jgi:hypothetical protein
MASGSNIRIRPLTVVLIGLGVACVIAAIVYFTTSAANLPSFFPGHQARVTRHHTKHGLALLGVAVVLWIAAWFTTSPGQPADGADSGH